MLTTVQGYPVRTRDYHVVSVEEGKRLRAADLRTDKSRVKYGFKPFVNPDTYTDEERKFMED